MNEKLLTKIVMCAHCQGNGNLRVVDGGKLRTIRKSKGISLRAMARRLEFSPAYISDVELGNRQGTVGILQAYASLK